MKTTEERGCVQRTSRSMASSLHYLENLTLEPGIRLRLVIDTAALQGQCQNASQRERIYQNLLRRLAGNAIFPT